MSDKMDKRIEDLLKVRRERPELHYVWSSFYTKLIDVLPSELYDKLQAGWKQIEVDEKMAEWDERFCESIVTGKPYGWQEPEDKTIGYPQQAQRSLRGGIGISAYETSYNTQTAMQMAEHIRLQQEKQRLDLKNQFQSYSGPDVWNTI